MSNIDRNKIIYRTYEQGDETQIISLMQRCFETGRDIDWFNWFYKENTIKGFVIYVAEYEGQIIAQRSFVPFKFIKNNNCITGAQATSSCTDSRFRRLGIYSKLAQLATDEVKKKGVSFTYSFPVYASYKGYIKLGWHDVEPISLLVRILNSVNVIKKVTESDDKLKYFKFLGAPIRLHNNYFTLRNKRRKQQIAKCINFNIQEKETINLSYNTIKKLNDKSEFWTHYVDNEYLNWRYNSKYGYKKFIVVRENTPVGYYVLKIDNKYGLKAGYVVEYSLTEKGVVELYMIECISEYFANSGVDFITLISRRHNYNWHKNGFLKSPIYKNRVVINELDPAVVLQKFDFHLGDRNTY